MILGMFVKILRTFNLQKISEQLKENFIGVGVFEKFLKLLKFLRNL